MLSCSPSLLEFAHRQPAGSANSHSRRSTRKIAAFRAGRTPVKAGLYSGCSDPRSKLAQGTTNHLYSVSAITNTAGQVVERYSYNAYGVRTVKNPTNVVIAKSAVNSDRGFTSYKLDGETGLYSARARMYSGKLGGFASRDSLRYRDGFSLYRAYFVPRFNDATGHSINLDLDPKTEVGVPWKNVSIPDSDPNFIIKGQTIVTAFKIQCACWACDKPTPAVSATPTTTASDCPVGGKYKFDCTIIYRANVEIDVSKHVGGNINKSYGHEQKHIGAELNFIKDIQRHEGPKTGLCDSDNPDDCTTKKEAFEASVNGMIKKFRTANAAHDTNFDPQIPVDGQGYDPTGPVPSESK